MNKRVIIEDSLRNHIKFLKQSGYHIHEVDSLKNTDQLDSFDYDAIVVANSDNIPMDATSFRPGAPIVEASDKTPEEVFNILRGRY
ncbi:MAG TPA: hypothetical protein GXX70_04280 [Tepidimicrobium sp.]|nr:hypothetical protein [Tepidimicrobium sp.]